MADPLVNQPLREIRFSNAVSDGLARELQIYLNKMKITAAVLENNSLLFRDGMQEEEWNSLRNTIVRDWVNAHRSPSLLMSEPDGIIEIRIVE